MTEKKKTKLVRRTSPKGLAAWPHLLEPDEYKGKLAYKIQLRVPQAEAADMMKLVDDIADAALAEANGTLKESGKRDKKGKPLTAERSEPYTVEVNKETGEPTGFIVFSFKSKNKPDLFDSQGKPSKANVWGGSTVRIGYAPAPYYIDGTNCAGCTCYLNAVQVIRLVTKGHGDASSHGFAAEEDGYEETASDEARDSMTVAADDEEETDAEPAASGAQF